MKLGLMPTDLVPPDQLRSLGFEAIQLFFSGDRQDHAKDPSPDQVDATLAAGNLDLAAMTLHSDLVGPEGIIEEDVERTIQCVEKTAALKGRFGANPKPILVWHPSGYPEAPQLDDQAVFEGLCQALTRVCAAAEDLDIHLAVELTRAGSVGSAETFLHLKDRIGSQALRVCIDAANFVPDRTPLKRAVRMLGSHIVIAHGKDSRFATNGEVCHYGPTGSGELDYQNYIAYLQEYANPAYFVFEYYQTQEDLLRARDIVQQYL